MGRRAGEKLEEDLFNSYERALPTRAEKISRAQRDPLASDAVEAMFSEISLLVLEGDATGLAAKVADLSATLFAGGERPLGASVPVRAKTHDRQGALLHSRDS